MSNHSAQLDLIEPKRRILIVDDVPANLELLCRLLELEYRVSAATSGEEAIQVATSLRPDLILLDVMMPGMNGYDVCRKLKEKTETAHIPVIFVTAKKEQQDEMKGLEFGAIDYITKPFSPEVVKARVKNHILLVAQRNMLEQSISLLEHEKEMLKQKAELGIQAGGLAHDMANVLTGIMHLGHIPDSFPSEDEWGEIVHDLKCAVQNVNLGIDICRGYTSYLQGLENPPANHSPAELMESLNIYQRRFRGELILDAADNMPPVTCKGWQIRRVLVNLFTNAMQAVESQDSPKISITMWSDEESVFISMKDNGIGIRKEDLPTIFDEFFTTKEHGTGLGLSICKQIIDAHGGTIQAKSEEGEGTEVIISFPASDP